MIELKPFDQSSKILNSVNLTVHNADIDSPIEQPIQFEDIDTILENLKSPENASQSIVYLCKVQDLEELLNQQSEIIEVIISYVSSDSLDLVIPSLRFIEKCCSLDDFPPEFLLDFISLDFLIEMAFSSDCKQVITHTIQIISYIVSSIGEKTEEDILSFLQQADEIDDDLLKSASIYILYSYLRKINNLSSFFQNINFLDRLNSNISMLKYPKQLMSSMKAIKFCIDKLDISYEDFNIVQIIKLMRSNIFLIQKLSIEIINIILLKNNFESINFKGILCKSFNWIFHKGSIKLILKALYCLQNFYILCSDEFSALIEVFDSNFFDMIFGLLSSRDNGSVEAISFLIFIMRNNLNTPIQQRIIDALLEVEIHEQLESLAATGDDIIATHSVTLLNLVDRFCDIES